ncbi:Rib/alpha-like domain-containing protein [Streptococcus suis]
MNLFKIKRNKLNRQEAFNFEKRSQFGIRKLTIGVVSLVIGSGMVLSGVEQVQAGTDYDPGVEIRYVRNGSPKALASDGDFKIEKSFVEVNGVQYVDVTLTFNQDHDGYARRFLYFNMPKSLYEPEKITRELYWQGERTPRETTEYRTWQGDYRFADEPWYRLWDHRYIIGSPDSLQGERHKKVTSPTDPGGDTIGGQSEGRWNGDWDRLMFSVPNNAGSGKEALTKAASDFKATSRTVYINRFSGSTDKHVYKFRARVKDGNAPMNFVVGLNEESGSHANFLAQYGTTPDTRTLAEKSTINPPARIGVNSLQDLSQQTRNNIAQKIREANPDLFNGAGPLVTNVTVSSDGIGGNAVLRFKDGSEKTIPMKQLVYKINTASGAAPTASQVPTKLVDKSGRVGLQGEDHQLNLPAKIKVDNIATIEDATKYSAQWNTQVTEFLKANTSTHWSGTGKQFFNAARLYGSQNWKAEFLTAKIKYVEGSNNKRIQGIEVSGPTKEYENVNMKPNGSVNTQVYGLLTPAMLFYQEDPLKTTKDEAKKTIDSIGNINGKANEWKRRIDEAQNQQAIEAIITEARNEKNALDKKKAAAIQEINALPHLSQNEKTAVINAINSATTTTVVDQKLNDAKALNTTNMRNKGKEAINALSKLNDGEKTPYRNRIDNATTQDQINAIIEEAAFEDLKRSALEQLDNMNPAPSNKDELRAQITETNFNTVSSDGKKPAERIEAILERAKAEVLRDQARRDINAISGLPEEKKNEFLGIVDRAQTPSEITNAVDQARAYSDYIQAKDAINQLTNINNKQKEELLAGLERDKSQQGVADMLTSARALDGEMKHLKDLVAQAETIKQSSDYSRADRAKQNTFNTALDAAKRVSPQTGELPTTSVGQLISNLTDAIRGLGGTTQPVTKDVDKGNLRAEIDRSSQVKDPANAEYTYASEDKKQAYEQALTQAIAVRDKANPVATQAEVDAALAKLQEARIALDGHAPDRVQDTLADSTNLVVPEAVQIKGTTVAEDEKQTIIYALKAANPSKLPDDTHYDVAPNGAVTVTYNDTSSEVVNVPLKSGIPTVTTQPHDLVVFKNTDMTTPVELAGFADNESISDVQIVSTNGNTRDEMGLTVGEKDKENNTKAALISGKTGTSYGVGKHTRKLRALDNLGQASAATNDFYVRVVDATVNQPDTAIEKAFGQALTPEDVRPKINFNVGSGQDNMIDFEVIIPADAPTSGQNKDIPVIIRTKAHANAPEDFKRTFVSQDKTVTVRATWPTQAAHIEVVPPANTAPALIDSARPTTETDKNALINALKEANKTPEGTSKFPENTTFDVAEDGTVTITYPDRSSEQVTVPFKQKDSAQHTPVVAETPIESATTAGTPLTEDERNAVKAAVTVPTFPAGDKQPTITVPDNASVTNGTNGNTGKPVVVATVEYPDGSTEQVEVPLKSGLPTVTTQPNDLVVFKNTDMTTPVELGGFTDNESIKDVQIVSTNGSTKDEMGLTVGEKDKGSNTKAALISGKTDSAIGKHTRKLRALDNLDQASAATNDFYVRIVDATVNQPETAIEKAFDQALTPEDVRPKINFNVGSGQDNLIDFEVIIPTDAPTSGQNKEVSVIIRTKAHANAPEDFKRTFVSQDKTVTVRATWPTQAAHIEVAPPADTAPALIDSARPTTDADKTALINALKEANKTPEGASKFPENTDFNVAENGAVTITYPDRSSETVTVPFKQKDSAQHTPVVTETPINSAATANTPLTEEERNAVKAAVTVPNYPAGDRQPTVTVPADARVTNGTEGNTGKPVVVATVEYPDGSSENVEVPVRQRDNAKYEATVTNPEAPAAIKASHETGTQITDQADKDAILAKVSVPTGSNGTPSLDQNPVVEEQGGKPVVKVTVTYPDQTTDTVYVPVDQKDNEAHNPTAPAEAVKLDAPATANSTLSDDDKNAIKAAVTVPANSGGQVSLAPDAKVELVNGNPVVKATVTYPDGTTDIVEVPVVQKDSTKHTPVLTEANSPVLTKTPAKANEPVQEDDKAAIAAKVDKTNLPQDTEIKVPDGAKVELVDNKPVVPVKVTYPDGTSETIKVPVDQKDSETYTPTAPNKDNAVAITSPQTPGTEITDPTDKAAILDSVTVPAVDGGQAPNVTKEITSPVTEGPDGPYVTVTVTYPDDTSEEVNVPVNQKDNAANNPTVTAPEKPAPISVPVAENTPVESDADKKLITDKVNVAGLPNPPQSVKVAEPAKVVMDQAGNPVVNVEVTYPDGTKDIVPVPVKQADNQTNTPSLKEPELGKPAEALVAIDPTPGVAITNQADKDAAVAKVDLSKLPVGTTAAVADGAVVANDPLTNKPVVPVTVTYPDGTSEIINVPVKQADNLALDPSLKDTNPVPILTEATVGLTVSDKANLDAIAAKVDPKTGKAEVVNNTIVAGKEDGPHAGQPVVNVLVTYPDGTQDTIEVPVKQADNVANEPSLTDQIPVPIQAAATTGTPVPADDKPAILAKVDLPAGAEATIADDATVVREDGQAVVPVTVTYPDGTTDTISVPVKRADNSKYTPSQVMDTVQVDAATAPGTAITSQDDKDAIIAAVPVPKVAAGEKAPVVSLPENPRVEEVNGQPVVKAIVTYADGTTDTVDVPIVQKVSATKEPSLKEAEAGKPAQAVITENPTAGASITDPADQNVILDKVVVPEGGKASIADDAVVEMDGDQPVLPVTVIYTDGSKDIIKVPVKQADNVAKEPSLKSQTPVGVMDAPAVGAQVEEPADLEAIKNNVDTKGGTASIEDPTIVEGPNNQPAVAVKVTYPDGTADTILVPIKTADNVTYTPVLKSTDPVLVSVATDNGTAVPEADQAKILANVDVPALTADGDKPAVDLSIENPVVLQKNGQAGVEVTVTYQDGSKDKIFVPVDTDTDKDGFSNKEEEKAGTSATDPASTPAGQDSAERLNPGLTEPVEVKNPDKLTDAEKEAVKKAVEDSNDLPAGTTVSVANDGTVTVTYPDNSTDTIKPKDAVTQFVDTDGDGISDRQETENGTDPSKVDSDNDGFSDKEEVERGTDPTKADSKPASSETDTDGDGISNEDEVARGTDPNKSDTDGDGFSDQEEITAGSNPTKADSTPANVDKDGDGFTDTEEAAAGTDANNPASTPAGQDSADRLNPGLTEPVEVKNPDKLTDAEKESVKKAVEDSNDLPEGTEVTVSDNGTVTVTYPDKSTDTIQPAETVKVAKDTDKDGFTDTEEAAAGTDANNPASTPAGQDSADRLNPGLTEPVEVKNPDKLTDAEKESVKKAVEDSNDLPEGTEVTVSDNGTVTVTYPDKSTDTIQPAETVKVAKDTDKDGFTDTEEATAGTDATNPASTPAGQDSAGQLTPSLAEPVEVKNPDKLTDAEKESVKKAVEDSNDLPEGTEVSVSGNGTVTVTYPDKSTDTIQPAETVKVAKDTDKDGFTDTEEATAGTSATDPSSTPAGQDSAGQLTPSLAEPVEVKNPDKLTDAEKESVKKAVEDSNDLPEGTEVTVSDNGTVTVTYPDKSTDTIQPAETVKVAKDTDKDGFTDTEEATAGTSATDPSSTPAGQDSADRLNPGLTEPVEVKNPDKLTDAEKESVKRAVEETNDLPAGTEVSVSDSGTVTVTYPDKSTDTIQPAETVKVAKDTDKDGFTDTEEATAGTDATNPASTPAGQDSAGQLTPSLTEPVEVKNPDKLTDAEKEAVKKAVEDSNDLPEGTEVTVSDNGTVTVTYPDKSADTIQPTDTVKAAKPVSETPVAPSKPEVTATDSGAVVVTPPTDNVTNLDITFTPEGASQPVTVVVSKDENGIWTAPADSGLVINPDGTITIPADKVADGTAVTVVAENGSISSPEVGSTVVPVPVVTPETPVAPSKPEVISTTSGDVVVTPPTDNVTNLDITFTPEGSSQPVTVVVSKDATGTWTAPADSGLVVNPDGTITIPAENVADGTAVTVVAENGSVSSPEVGSAVVPVPTPELPAIPAKPTSVTNADGSVTIVPPVENVTGLDITFTPEGATEPVTVTLGKDATGAWTAPADSGLVVNPDGTITIPADRLADGTEGQVGLVAKNGDLTSNDPAPQVPETPAKSSVETNENGSVTIVPPVENVTGIDITFTPEGASQPVTVVVSKDATGAWTAPADSGLVVNPDGTITIPADKVADGTAVSVVTKNGQVPSDEASATYVPAKPASTDTPVVEVPATPSLALDGSGNVLITPPAENATSLDITFTPAGSETPITVTANKDATGNWILPETSIAVVNPDGTISISTSEMEGGTAVSVVAKNEGVPSSQAATLLVQPKQTAEELAPTVKKPIAVEDASKLTDAEKKELEDVVRKDNVLPEGTEVSVADDGTVTVTYPDKSTDTILPTKTVMDAQNGEGVSHSLPAYDLTADEDKDGFTNEEELKQGSNAADAKSVPAGKSSAERLTPTNDLAVKVKDLTKLSDAEKKAVETAIRKDKDLPEGTQIEVANDGSVTITYPDGSIGRLPADQTVLHATHGEGVSHSLPAYDLTADEDKDGFTNEEELKQGSNVADAKSVPAGKSSAERLTPTNDLAVKVKDLTKLTDAEKKAVETAIRKNNILPEGTQIEVANDGSVTITYPDGSVDQIVATKVVATDSTVSPDSGVSQSSGTTKVLPGSASSTRAAKKPLPATGGNGSPILVLSGLALLAGVAMFRKAKREDEN